jgi:hypothetical protein
MKPVPHAKSPMPSKSLDFAKCRVISFGAFAPENRQRMANLAARQVQISWAARRLAQSQMPTSPPRSKR